MRARETVVRSSLPVLAMVAIGLFGCSSSSGARSGSGGTTSPLPGSGGSGLGGAPGSGGSDLGGGTGGTAGTGVGTTLDGAIGSGGAVPLGGAQGLGGIQGPGGAVGTGGSSSDAPAAGTSSGGVVGSGGGSADAPNAGGAAGGSADAPGGAGADAGTSSGSDAGTSSSLLANAVPFTGSYPEPGTVRVTVNGAAVDVVAIPGQVIVHLYPRALAWADAEAFLRSLGGTVLAKLPEVGMYLVGVQPGSEDKTIQAAMADQRVSAAGPNLVLASSQDDDPAARKEPALAADQGGGTGAAADVGPDGGTSRDPLVIIIEDDCRKQCAGSEHAWLVGTVLEKNGARPTHCLTIATVKDLWSTLWGLVFVADLIGPSRPVLFNLSMAAKDPEPKDPCVPWHPSIRARDSGKVTSYQGSQFLLWYGIVHTLASALATIGPDGQPWLAGALAAGNAGIPLDPIISSLYWQFGQDADRAKDVSQLARNTAALEPTVLQQNVIIVGQNRRYPDFESRFDYVGSWNGNASSAVVTTDNRWSAYGTSFAAPYALAQIYYLVRTGNMSTADAVQALKRGASSGSSNNPDHTAPSYTGDQPPFPAPASDNQVAPTDDSLFDCPVDSAWTPDDKAGPAKGYCLFDYRDPAAPMTVTSSATAPGLPAPVTTSTSTSTSFGVPLAWADRKPATPDMATMQSLMGGAGQMTEFSCDPTDQQCEFKCVEKATSALGGSYVETVDLKYQRSAADGDFTVAGSESLQGVTMSDKVEGTFHAPLASLWPRLPGCPLTSLDGAQFVINLNGSQNCTSIAGVWEGNELDADGKTRAGATFTIYPNQVEGRVSVAGASPETFTLTVGCNETVTPHQMLGTITASSQPAMVGQPFYGIYDLSQTTRSGRLAGFAPQASSFPSTFSAADGQRLFKFETPPDAGPNP